MSPATMDEKERKKPSRAGEEPKREGTSLAEYLESLLVTVVLALFGTSFVVQAFKIPSPSMESTLLVGDHLLVNKFIFGGRGGWYDKLLPYRVIRRGDIIVFRFPYQDHPHYVKRVIGVPGDRIKIVDQQVYANGQPLYEPYAVHDPGATYDVFSDTFPPPSQYPLPRNLQPEWAETIRKFVQGGELVVPPGKYFAMGDNRDRSWDSRYWGFVDRDAIMGRPILIYWSIEGSGGDSDSTFWSRLAGVADTLVHLPSRTRWSRMLHLVH